MQSDDPHALAVPFRLTRAGIIMSADPSDPLEAEGVLNPATAGAPTATFISIRAWLRQATSLASARHA